MNQTCERYEQVQPERGPAFAAKIPTKPRSHLQQIIAALTEGIIIVEPDGRISWADETALSLHGVNKLAELGGTAAGYAKRFQVAYLGGQPLPPDEYPIERLLQGEVMDRAMVEVTSRANGKRHVHETRTMALTDQEGQVDCLVLILDDETERFNAEERFERAFNANPAPAIIARLSDMRYVKVNHGFIELSGYLHGALIGHSMHEIDVLRGAERRDLAIKRLHAARPSLRWRAVCCFQTGGRRLSCSAVSRSRSATKHACFSPSPTFIPVSRPRTPCGKARNGLPRRSTWRLALWRYSPWTGCVSLT